MFVVRNSFPFRGARGDQLQRDHQCVWEGWGMAEGLGVKLYLCMSLIVELLRLVTTHRWNDLGQCVFTANAILVSASFGPGAAKHRPGGAGTGPGGVALVVRARAVVRAHAQAGSQL